MTNFLTLKEAREVVKPFVDSGACKTPVLDARIYEACRRLMTQGDWPHTMQTVRIRTDNGCFPLPREAERIVAVNVCGEASNVFNQHYEFLSSGPGEIGAARVSSGIKGLVDAGLHSTMYDIPSIESLAAGATTCVDRDLGAGLRIFAFSDRSEDFGKEISLWGLNRLNMDIGTVASGARTPGEKMQIAVWDRQVEGQIAGPLSEMKKSPSLYRQLNYWQKPVTLGYVTLYAVDEATQAMYLLAKAHPEDTTPQWRRYRITNRDCSCVSCVYALVKLKCLPLSRETDILAVQNLDAIKNMAIAIREENAGNLQGALMYEQNAIRVLQLQKGDHESSTGMPVILDVERSLSLNPCNRRLI